MVWGVQPALLERAEADPREHGVDDPVVGEHCLPNEADDDAGEHDRHEEDRSEHGEEPALASQHERDAQAHGVREEHDQAGHDRRRLDRLLEDVVAQELAVVRDPHVAGVWREQVLVREAVAHGENERKEHEREVEDGGRPGEARHGPEPQIRASPLGRARRRRSLADASAPSGVTLITTLQRPCRPPGRACRPGGRSRREEGRYGVFAALFH